MSRRVLPAVFLLLALVPFAGMLAKTEVPLFRDHATYFLPLRWHTAQSLAAGDLPLWNPYNGLGEPWAANPQTAVFYPPAWIFLALPFETAYVLFLALHLALLGAGAYALFRRWAPEVPSAFGATALMFCGPVLSLLDVGNNLTSFAWMPLVIRLALERRADRARPPLAVGAALALMFLGGEPLYAAIAAAVVAATLAGARDWTGLAKSALWAIALSAVQLFPLLAWIRASDRTAGLDPAEAFRHAMAAGDWLTLTFSTANPSGRYVPLRIEQTFLPSLYMGIPVVLLALGAGVGSLRSEDPERRRTIAILFFAFAAVLLLSAAPRFEAAREWLLAVRLNAIRYPARLVPIGALIIAALAAIGLDRVRKEPRSWRVAVTFWIALLGGIRFLALEPLGRDVTLHRFAIFLGWIVVFGVLYVALPRWLADRRVALLLIAVLCADLLWSARPLLAPGRLVHDRSGWSARLDPPWRFVRVTGPEAQPRFPRADRWLFGYKNLYTRRFDFATPAPVVPSRFLSFFRTARRGDRDDLVDLASVRWVLSTRARLRKGYVPTGADRKDVRLFDNRGAFPAVQFWTGAAAAGERDPFERLLGREFDARRRIEVSPAPVGAAAEGGARRVDVRAALRFDGSSAAATIDAPSAGVVVLTQLAADGWRVEVDGSPATPLLVDGLFRGVEIGAGTHRVRWIYRPLSLYAGGAVTGVALLFLAVFAAANRRLRSSKIA
ncbi:MAG TPA: hypothetical protein VFV54_00385 [Thermoanaerobaculia bacterium]|nr:hypothetical protein [Thermoanaerobaculia bacterium]